MEKREKFTNKMGFILSCVGAAIGLGNIWMFSWKLGKYGGGAFLIPYFIFMALFSVIGLTAEISMGRMMKKGVLGVSEIFKNRKIPLLNYIPTIPIIAVSGIFTFYVIVFGWVIKYFVAYITLEIKDVEYSSYFNQLAGTSQSISWHLLAVVISVGVISLGIVKGIEKANRILMPLMFIIFISLAVKSLSLPGAIEGVKYLLIPDWKELMKPMTWIMALGQAFFTVGISGAALLVYGSYLGDDVDIVDTVFKTCILDTVAALISGFIIIPAAFSFGMDPTAGPALLFITVPGIFAKMPGGIILGSIFFLSVIFAALSSAINLLEVPTEALIYKFKYSRKKAAIIAGTTAFLVGIFLDVNMDIFGIFADFMNAILLPLGAALILGLYFYFMPSESVKYEIEKGATQKYGAIILNIGKYIFVPGTVTIVILGLIYGSIG